MHEGTRRRLLLWIVGNDTASDLLKTHSSQVYDLMRLLSLRCIKTYPSLTKIQQIDWNNRLVFPFSKRGIFLYVHFLPDIFNLSQGDVEHSCFLHRRDVSLPVMLLGFVLWQWSWRTCCIQKISTLELCSGGRCLVSSFSFLMKLGDDF